MSVGRPPDAGRVRAVGDAALLVRTPGPDEARALADRVLGSGLPGVLDVVGGLRSVLVTAEPGTDLAALSADIDALVPAAGRQAGRQRHRIPVALGGPDLAEVCRLAGVDPDGLAELLTATALQVAMVGFSPGFAYLEGLPDRLRRVPRRASPRPAVPAGAVAVAGGFAAVYPQATPGGWQLVGSTGARLFDPVTPPHALLRPGDEVVLELSPADPGRTGGGAGEDASRGGADRPARRPLVPPAGCRVDLVVEDPGAYTVAQDAGRAGRAHLGVPGAGPADPLAHALANRLVGNDRGATALEITARGPVLRCASPEGLHVAVVGADPEVLVDGRAVGAGHVVPVGPGQRLAVGTVRGGLRTYLAVAGGLSVPEVMGSTATDALSRLGPGPLLPGDELSVGAPPGPMADRLAPEARQLLRRGTAERRTVRVLPGPHGEWFGPDALERLTEDPWSVDAASDRVGLRLRHPTGATVPRRQGELDSQGMVTGALQVPPSGSPVVLGPDHATLGGYPVVAVVASADRWLLGQCRPGDQVTLVPVTLEAAAVALGELRRTVGAVTGRYPTATA